MDFCNGITDVPGILVGHAHDREALTGCTVILCCQGATAGVDVRGAAPGTRETDLLNPVNMVEKVHSIVLTGGSAFGLDAAAGVMAFLEERGCGFNTGVARVPIVPAAVIYDLAIGSPKVRPDRRMGYEAAKNATCKENRRGNVGAGMGATVGKIGGMSLAVKSGLGMASISFPNGGVVAALVVVNAFGDVFDPSSGRIIAGARQPGGKLPLHTTRVLLSGAPGGGFGGANTTVGLVATNIALSKAEANKVAQLAHDGLARTISPIHTLYDGDTIFALSTGEVQGDSLAVGVAAAEVTARAVIDAVTHAESAGGVPCARELGWI